MQKIKTYGKRTFRLIPNTKSAASSTTPAAKWDLSDSDDSDGKEEIKIRAAPNVVVVHPEPVNSTSTVSPSRSSASQQQEGAVAVVDKEKKETSTEEEKEKREPEALQVSLLDDAQLPTRVSVCIDDLLLLSSRQQIISFEELYKDRISKLRKIGEATYSEVYGLYNGRSKAAMKVLPFDGKDLVNGSVQQSLQDIYEEVKITSVLGKSLNTLVGFETNFVKLIDSFICHGPYPDYLLQEIDKWAEKNNSENDRPDYFTKNQLFMVLILENGGEDLEHCHKFKSWKQVKGLLAQTIFSTAVAERLIKFEHRDLHWGNLLCSPCAAGSVHRYELQKKNIMCGSEMAVMEIETDGIRACIIDFTLSRLEFDSHVFAVHLDDEDLYTGEGDYQFDIYRHMKRITGGNWDEFYPKTNIYWFHYMCEKIQEFKLSKPMFAMEKEMEEFKDFIDRILDFKDSWELMMDPFLSEVITVKPASHPSSTSSTLDQDLASLMDSLSLITTTAAAVRR